MDLGETVGKILIFCNVPQHNSRLPEEHFVCYQTLQRNWVIINVLYRCLQRYMLSWHNSRLGFVTPIVGEVSLGPLGNTHHLSLASIVTNELVIR